MSLRRVALAILPLLLIGGAVAARGVVAKADREMNGFVPADAPKVGAAAEALHAQLEVADLHADSLLWGRDMHSRQQRGHVDLVRMREGNMALQVFGVVSSASPTYDYHSNTAEGDKIGVLMAAQGASPKVFKDLPARANFQAKRLQRWVDGSDGELIMLRSAADVKDLRARRAAGESVMGGLLAMEGAHGLNDGERGVDQAFELGFRMVGLAHFFDNAYAGSLHGAAKGGLTEQGRALVQQLERRGMIIDLAHASPTVVDQVLAMGTRPVVVSHAGVHSVCPGPRNLSDAQMKRIAAAGGLVGIGFWEGAVCDISPRGVARSINAAVKLLGVQHVALGSDWDGTITTSMDVAALPQLTQALLDEGLTEAEIHAVMGGNLAKFLQEQLP